MTKSALKDAYDRVEAAMEGGDDALDDFFLTLRGLPEGAPFPASALLPPPWEDAPPLDDALMASLLAIPGPRESPLQRLKAWILQPGPMVALALLLVALIPLLSQPKGAIKGSGTSPGDLSHALSLHIVTQGPEGDITRRTPETGEDGTLTTPIRGDEAFQLVLKSPNLALDDAPRYAFVAALTPGETPKILLSGEEILTPAYLPETQSLYTLPRPLTLGPPTGPRRLVVVLSKAPMTPSLRSGLLSHRSPGDPLPLLSAEEALSLGAVEGSIPMEVRK